MSNQIKNTRNKIPSLKKLGIGLILLFLIIVGLSACSPKEAGLLQKPDVKQVDTMGTYVKVTSYTPKTQKALANSLSIATKYDQWVREGYVYEINRQAGVGSVKVPKDLFQLLKDTYNLSSQNTGYDVTIGPLTQLWRIGFPDARVPSQAEIQGVLPLINHQFLQLDESNQTVGLTQEGAQLDLGSMTKGYVARLMTQYLKSHGVKNAIVDLGSSSLYVLGHGPRGLHSRWNVGIKDPNHPNGENLGILAVKNQFISTSGIYERKLTVDGKTYPHILNPKTGYPFDNDIQSVTIVGADNPSYGDGVTTAVFALGTKAGYDYVLSHKLNAIFVDKANKIYITPGLKKSFTLNSKSDYQLADIETLKGKG